MDRNDYEAGGALRANVTASEAARARVRRLTLVACALPLVYILYAGAVTTASRQGDGQGTRRPQESREERPEAAPVATVDGEPVSLERFNRLYQARVSPVRFKRGGVLPAAALQVKAEVAERLIDERLIEKAAARGGVTIPPERLEAAWREFMNTFPDAASFRAHYTRAHGTEEEARAAVRIRLLEERLAGVDDLLVSDEEARDLYGRNLSLYRSPAHLTAQAVVFLVPAGAGPDVEAAQRRKAEEFRDHARQRDVSFYLLSRKYARDPAVRVEGFMDRVTGQSVPAAVWGALSGAEPEQVSGPVRTPEGFAVLKLLSRRPALDKTFEQVRGEIKASLRESIRAARLGALRRGLRAEARVENHLLTRYPSAAPAAPARLEGGIVAPETIPPALPRGSGAAAPVKTPGNR